MPVGFFISKDPDLVTPARDGTGNTLADFAPLRTAAEVLDELGAHSANLVSSEEPSLLGAVLGAVGVGYVATEAGDDEVLLVIVADETTADAAVDLVVDRITHETRTITGEPWRTTFDVRSTLVDGHVGIVRLGRLTDVPVERVSSAWSVKRASRRARSAATPTRAACHPPVG